MTDIEAFKYINQLNGCMMIRYEVFMVDLIFTLNLVDDQLGITISFKILYRHLLSEVEANDQMIDSATLLELDSINENARGRT